VAGETPKPHRVTQRVSETFISESVMESISSAQKLISSLTIWILSTLKLFVLSRRFHCSWTRRRIVALSCHTNEPFLVLQEMGKFGEPHTGKD